MAEREMDVILEYDSISVTYQSGTTTTSYTLNILDFVGFDTSKTLTYSLRNAALFVQSIDHAGQDCYTITYAQNAGIQRVGYIYIDVLLNGDLTYTKYFKITQEQQAQSEKILFRPDDNPIYLPYSAGTYELNVDYAPSVSLQYVAVQAESGSFITPSFPDADKWRLRFEFTANQTSYPRTTWVKVITLGAAPGVYEQRIVKVIQNKSPEIKEYYASKDMFVEYTTESEYSSYVIKRGDEEIYAGKAYAKGGNVKVYMNDIINNILSSRLDMNTLNELQNTGGYELLSVYGDGEHKAEIYCYSDYSYDVDDMTMMMSRPVQHKYVSGQIIPITVLKRNSDPSTLLYVYSISGGVETQEDSLLIAENGYRTILWTTDEGHDKIRFDIADYYTTRKVEFSLVSNCGNYPYELIYRNPYNGFDTMLFNKTSKMTDSIANDDIELFEEDWTRLHTYQYIQRKNQPTWQLKTDILNDDESARFNYLVRSNEVYLHELGTDNIIPVVITTTSADRLTYMNNSCNPIQYTLNVKQSRTEINK